MAARAEREFRFGVLRQLFGPVVESAPPDTRQRWFAGAAAHATSVLSPESAADEQSPTEVVDQRLLHALNVLTGQVGEGRPLLLLVDDLHCADAASLSRLGYLARRLDSVPVTVVVTVRDGDPAADRAGEPLREAVTVLAASDNRLRRAKTFVLLGRAMREEGYDEADEWLRQGHALAGRCGATWLVEAAGVQTASGSPIRRSSGTPSAVSGLPVLTTAERQVARLAAAGHTNPEIADHLSVTPRTVEEHLTNTYRELAIPGRSGLARALRADQ